jgi:hypothetical protein
VQNTDVFLGLSGGEGELENESNAQNDDLRFVTKTFSVFHTDILNQPLVAKVFTSSVVCRRKISTIACNVQEETGIVLKYV